MRKWTRPTNYYGASWPDYYVFLSRNRDSDALERSNFEVALSRLGRETGEDDEGISAVTVVRESHFLFYPRIKQRRHCNCRKHRKRVTPFLTKAYFRRWSTKML